jgi:ATP-dependent Clp protease protease subunit
MTEQNHDSAELDAAKVAALQAETRKLLAEAETAEYDAKVARLTYQERQKRADIQDATDDNARVYVFDSEVTNTSVRLARATLLSWSREHPGEPIEIVFNSPGGSVFAGWMLFDVIRGLSRAGHPVTTIAQGMAASMAGILLQAGDVRVIGAESYLMLHEVSTGAIGKVSEIQDTAKLAERLTRQACEVFARKSTLSAEELYERMSRRDLWLQAEEALELGLVDEIR